jgi:CRP-like cAMP-binding protein
LALVSKNRLIELLPRRERVSLLAICEPIVLVLSEVLHEVRTKTRYVYFPIDGFVSLLSVVDDQSVLEVGMVGREGMLGVHVALGMDISPLHAVVQGPGTAWRIPVGPFRRELKRSPGLQRGLNRYVAVLMSQLASQAACVRYHSIGPRLARWLLMSQDRAEVDQFFMTQEFLAYMLGVRRVGVTSAASVLQKHGLIEYHRGQMKVLDRKGLESAACNCYASDQISYGTLTH